MIDKNGKLFGKINVIDLLVILVVVVALALVGLRALRNQEGEIEIPKTQKVRITFYGDSVYDYLPDSIQPGDVMTDLESKQPLGQLEEGFIVEPAVTYTYDTQRGETVEIPVYGRCFLTFTSVAEGSLDGTGLVIGDNTFVVGGQYYVNIGNTRTGCRIRSFEIVG